MAIMKVIEVMAQSTESWEDAARQAVTEASRTLHGIKSVYIKHFMAEVENGQVTRFRVNAKITLEVDGARQ